MANFFTKALDRIFGTSPESRERVIRIEPDGVALFNVQPEALVLRFKWADVVRIHTFKRDLFSFDEICLQFDLADGSCVTLGEEDADWAPLMQAVQEHFPLPADWWGAVMKPAFVANYRVLWEKLG